MKVFVAVGVVLFAVVLVLHLSGHGMGEHARFGHSAPAPERGCRR